MNYYEHHLGDYFKDAGHLSMIEHGAYRLLLDAYYIREMPLPLSVKDCCKLARATSKAEREAVEYVLRQFFQEQEDGWHQDRADREIVRYKDKQAKAQRSANARWNASKDQSERNANASTGKDSNAMRTHSEGNAHQAPVTSNQTPNPSPHTASTTEPQSARASPGDLSRAMRKAGIDANPSDPRIMALAEQGVMPDTVAAACQSAKDAKPGERIPAGYVIAIIERWAKEASQIEANGAKARASPTNRDEDRARASEILTGRRKENNERNERDITGTAVRVA